MSKEKTSQSNLTLFAEDFLVSHFPMRESSAPKTTPAISGRKCLDLSGNAGPLGLLEKTLLESSNWAWTKYSLTWQTKATPQGRLIFQLARLAPRIFDSDSGLLHTPTAKANQTSPSMVERGQGNWVSSLWPTPRVSMANGPSAKEVAQGNPKRRLETEVELWQTPVADDSVDREKGKWNSRGEPKLSAQVKLWPTPSAREKGGGEYQDPEKIKERMAKGHQANLGDTVKLWPAVNAADPKSGGKLNPQWVAWLMGYPTEYLNSVPWETRSSRKSRKKSGKQ